MSKVLIAALGAILFVGVGCQNDGGDMSSTRTETTTSSRGDTGSDAMRASMDDCPHCAGVQTARADGTCPQCGMKVSTRGGTSR